ncbi:histidine triad nucleotide-binding protein [Candidatus Oleimmundimicrobium sp.]|uniref:histidine triad nucleotide-binding protein n=1 Tax=Candidatus Oleimmundimicrobium sp. TaxID=3060597 RepID=UPI00272503A0|nr:histidine triad nucleotide-binding protein [Candidatus Oleimmundimicrobium sp.]MDO8885848.1 histidine triad nucleotide-binding protein [Candidatus Oleimmundimicrobium sp.]
MAECIFCKIVQGQIPSEIVYEDDKVIAFRDINPQAKIHIIIVPKKHINPMNEINENQAEIMANIFLAAKEIAKRQKIGQSGFRMIVNVGPDSGQEIEHLHFHLLGGEKLGKLVT